VLPEKSLNSLEHSWIVINDENEVPMFQAGRPSACPQAGRLSSTALLRSASGMQF
jgi:hypothetical protein